MKKISYRESLLFLGIFGLLATGCTPKIPQPELPKQESNRTKMWQDSSTVESNYKLKPEPYSLDSKQHDPELLGPQSTLKRPLEQNNLGSASSSGEEFLPKEPPRPTKAAPKAASMDRSHCVSLIGKSKYDEYTQRFGSEEAAIRKCIILQRVQKQ